MFEFAMHLPESFALIHVYRICSLVFVSFLEFGKKKSLLWQPGLQFQSLGVVERYDTWINLMNGNCTLQQIIIIINVILWFKAFENETQYAVPGMYAQLSDAVIKALLNYCIVKVLGLPLPKAESQQG